jgi:hypothetical protein
MHMRRNLNGLPHEAVAGGEGWRRRKQECQAVKHGTHENLPEAHGASMVRRKAAQRHGFVKTLS